jgi:hypothetical protein
VAITPSQIKFGPANSGITYPSGSLEQVFGAGTVGGATDYRLMEIRNTSALTYTSPVVWLSIDTGGAAVAIAVADTGTARDMSYSYDGIDPTALTYSTPTTETGGLALPTLAAGQKCLVAIRRTLVGAVEDDRDNNTLNVAGDSPA